MPIDITIIKFPQNVSNSAANLTFTEAGGSLGRGPDNAWVLDDPDKYMSSMHTQIGFEDGQYVLTDLSTNGTFVNGASEPLGKGNKVLLAEGDRFAISDYEFVVNIRGVNQSSDDLFSQQVGQGPFSGSEMNASGMTGNAAQSPFPQNDPFAASENNYVPISDAMSGFDGSETDPLAALDKANTNNQESFQSNPFTRNSVADNSFTSNSVADNGGAMNESIDWPGSNIESGMIPDNWDEESPAEHQATPISHAAPSLENADNKLPENSFSNVAALSKLENEYLALENENKKLLTHVARLKQYIKKQNATIQPEGQAAKRTFTSMDKTLIESMGFSEHNLDKEKMMEISETVGLLVRESLEGMMRVLSFRKKIKEEFRINVTTIQPVENNPLKFSANINDAMENMFIKENNAYKEPIEAVREGFQGIAEHQVAVLAGMQAAFRGMLERFDPESLEKRFEKYAKSGLIKIGKNKKNWESYKAYHAELAGNMDNSFQYLFGYDFVQAYEEQMQRLVISRKSNINK